MATIKINPRFITVDGVRAGVSYAAGPWISGIDPNLIKIRPKKHAFPNAFKQAFVIENNSDMQIDYFESDCIRILPSHPLYEQIKKAARS